jgi:hypothetical protein
MHSDFFFMFPPNVWMDEKMMNPGSCTYLCQPVDVGDNHPIKKEMMEQIICQYYQFCGWGIDKYK